MSKKNNRTPRDESFSDEVNRMKDDFKMLIDDMENDEFMAFISLITLAIEDFKDEFNYDEDYEYDDYWDEEDEWEMTEDWEDDEDLFYGNDNGNIESLGFLDDENLP